MKDSLLEHLTKYLEHVPTSSLSPALISSSISENLLLSESTLIFGGKVIMHTIIVWFFAPHQSHLGLALPHRPAINIYDHLADLHQA